MERLLPWFESSHGIRSAVLRYFNAAGAAEDGSQGEDWHEAQNPVPVVLKTAAGQRPLCASSARTIRRVMARPSGTTSTSSISLRHIAVPWRRSTRGMDSLTVNVGTGVGASVLEGPRSARRITGREIRTEAAPVGRAIHRPSGPTFCGPRNYSPGVRRVHSTTSSVPRGCGTAVTPRGTEATRAVPGPTEVAG